MKVKNKTGMPGYYLHKLDRNMLFALSLVLFSSCNQTQTHWFRGNMHTHSFWSDGKEFPENVARWYKENGYHFLVLTEGNAILEGERWHNLPEQNVVLQNYITDYGREWTEIRAHPNTEGIMQVRLKTLEEFRTKYEEPGRFLLIMGNEISNTEAVHLLAFDQDRIIPALQGEPKDREDMIRQTVKNVSNYRNETGKNVHAVLTHPNYNYAITAEMMLNVPELRYVEIYNGHPGVNNEGNENRAGTERMWDIVLSNRLSSGKGEVLYGLATDDAHDYHGGRSGPGRGWVMVRSEKLTPEALFDAIDKGDFYSSTGVVLKNISFDGKSVKLEIEPQKGVEYVTEFIGSLKGVDLNSRPTTDADGTVIENTTRTYSNELGKVLATSRAINPSYTFSGDELYVRARISSTADQTDPNSGTVLGKQKAWVQPFIQIQ